MPSRGRRPRRPGRAGRRVSRNQEPLDADAVLDTAARLIERDGVDTFTMRALAEQLGVAVTSIYCCLLYTSPSPRDS